MANNLPLGTHFSDGVRSGPIYSGKIPASLLPFAPATDASYGGYNAYGPGILNSPQNTWSITPQPAGIDNLVSSTTVADAGGTDFTLAGDNLATKRVGGPSPYVQFDWPRVVTVTVSGGAIGADRRITIFGTDWYGMPLQHTYVINAAGTYPAVTFGGGATNGFINIPSKAFYTVDRVNINGTSGSTPRNISLGVSDVFGLPFLVNNFGDVTSIGWGNNSDIIDNSIVTGRAAVNGTSPVVISCPSITANSNIQVTRDSVNGGTPGIIQAPSASIVPGVSFTILSAASDVSKVYWSVITSPTSSSGASGAMVAGLTTINTPLVQANSIIQLSMGTFGTAAGQWRVETIVPGVSFTVRSNAPTETSTVKWVIIPPNWVSGTSATLGTAPDGITPVAGSVTVSVPTITANSKILLTHNTLNGTPGVLSVPAVGINTTNNTFTITSNNTLDTSTVNWTIVQENVLGGTASTQGTATLVAGTRTVSTTAIETDSVVLITVNTLLGTIGTYIASTISSGTSFTLTSQNAADVSTVNWAIFPANYISKQLTSPSGAFVPADQTFAPTATTGDVRGLYAPSTPSNGSNTLRFTAYVEGADAWFNQVANSQFLDIQNNQPLVGATVLPLTPADLYGYPQFYTGSAS